MKKVTTVLMGCTLLTLGFLVGHSSDTPQCPTEDSCTVTYENGRYLVTPVVP